MFPLHFFLLHTGEESLIQRLIKKLSNHRVSDRVSFREYWNTTWGHTLAHTSGGDVCVCVCGRKENLLSGRSTSIIA